MNLRFLLLLFLLISACKSYSQDLSEFLEHSDNIRSVYAIEKVHLHMDKPYYAAGQTIWLKAYVVDGANRPSMLSKIIYVELIDERNRITKSLKLPLAAGLASGDITLADTLGEGNYRVRAYTQWMRNFGESGFYDQVIAIGNSLSNNILSKVNYSYSTASGIDHIEATISYKTLEGSVLEDKEVSYNVQLQGKVVLEGKGITDKEGKLKISFESRERTSQTGWIYTSFTHNDKLISKVIPVKYTRSEVSVQFFPEGGHLVDSIPSKIAFKAIGSNGLGADISGYVIDDQQARVAEFKTEHAGMGTFMLSPYGRNYTAIVSLPEGEKRIALPEAEQQGYVLTVLREDKERMYIRITTSKVTQRLNPDKELSIVAQSGAETHVISKFKLDRQFIDVAFLKKALPAGVTRLTLFENNSLKSERLMFIQHNDELDLKLNTDKDEYGLREKVKMGLMVKDKEGQAVTGSFSVSVTDMNCVPVNQETEHTILSELLIKSELGGYIENPNYYFIDSGSIRKSHLENLLLTQGWRRLSWKEIENQSTLPRLSFPPESSIEISGVVTLRGNPVEKSKVVLFTPEGGTYLDTITNARGRFNFDKLVFPDSTRFVIQGKTTKEKDIVQIRLDRIAPQQVSLQGSYADFRENVSSSILPYLKDSKEELTELIKQGLLTRNNLLEEVVVKARKNPSFVENSSNLSTTGADYVIRRDRLEGYTNLGLALQGKIPGIQIDFDPTGTRQNGTTATLLRNRDKMRLFVDGADWGNDLNFVNVNDIAAVEILRGGGTAALYGQKASGGIIIVTTKAFAGIPVEALEGAQGLIQYRPRGYTIAREFYSPSYDVPESKKEVADLRTTIYWNPELFNEKDKNPVFEFFTADRPGTYRAVVEGLDHRGKLGRSVYTFKVLAKK